MNATMLELDIFYLDQWDASTNQTLRAGVVALLEDPEPVIRAGQPT